MKLRRTATQLILFVAAGVALACSGACSGDSDKGANNSKPSPVAKKDAGLVAAPQDAAAASEIPRLPDGFATVGIASCDEYVTKQRKCLEDKAPENIRKPQLLGLRSIAAKWAEAAKAERREQLEKTCTHMLASSAKATTSAWGCSW